ncbi:MAG TPA: TIGR03936 family radical SAM-associated protein [Acidimicrobiales bacterium]|nr:TIGR03936 family radical SAM-associated protein [Acidimicrobiales bacterium]
MKVRLRFSKLGRVRWTSHRDVARVWERALRRASIPVAYSAGFSPHPLLSFGLALPTGSESVAEYFDVTLREELDPGELALRLAPGLPEGIAVMAAAPLEAGVPSLQQEVAACTWEIDVPGVGPSQLSEEAARLLAADSLPVRRMRKGRTEVDDLRPMLRVLTVRAASGSGGSVLDCEVATRPRGVRPTELQEALGLPLGLARRTSQWIERDGSRWEPLTAGAALAVAGAGSVS